MNEIASFAIQNVPKEVSSTKADKRDVKKNRCQEKRKHEEELT